MNTKYIYLTLGILIGGVVIYSLNAITPNSKTVGMMGNNSLATSSTIDAHFIEQMIPHHEDAITMAKLAQTKAQRPEVKQLAANIIESQGKEINQMKDWYKSWFGKELPSGQDVMSTHGMMSNNNGMHMGVRGDQSDIAKLEQASDFDTAFVEHMIPHHQMAVMMASMLKGGTQRSEMKELADDIISAQTREIDQMRQWLSTW